jgi:hypothetical protein
MNVSAIGNALNALNVSPLDALQATGGIANRSLSSGSSQTDGVSGGAGSAEISRSGQLLSKLQQLQTKDPAKFKQVLSDIAGKLQSLAQQQGQSASGQWLSKLADRFQTAANTGDLSALQPQGHTAHGHHHAHGAAGAYGQTSAQGPQALEQSLTTASGASSTDSLKSQLSGIFGEIDTALSH